MKTQINNLVKGNQFVSGTNHEVRKQVGQQVLAENGSTLRVSWMGVEISLQYSQSCSGKSWRYTGIILPKEAELLNLPKVASKATEEFYSVQLDSSMFFTLFRHARRGNSPVCKMREMTELSTENVIIL